MDENVLYDVVDRQGLRDGLPWGVIRHLDLSDDVRELSRPLPRCGLVRVQTYAATPRRVQQLDDDTVRMLRDAHEDDHRRWLRRYGTVAE